WSTGPIPNLVGEKGIPPLFSAISDNRAEFVELLVRHGANIALPSLEGLTPLMFAVGNSSEAVVRALVNGGAPIVQILLDHGGDMEKVNVSGRSALSVAAAAGDEAVVRLLVGRGGGPT